MIPANLVATLAISSRSGRRDIPLLPREVHWLEVRGDRSAPPVAEWLRRRFNGRLILSASAVECDAMSDEERRRMLVDGGDGYDMIDLDADRDLHTDYLTAIPPERRMITWRGAASDLDELRSLFLRISSVPAALYRIIPHAKSFADVVAPLLLLKSLRRVDLTAYAAGADGSWSRVLAPHFGAPIFFGGADEASCDDGAFTVRTLIDDYDAPWLHPVEELLGIVGSAVHRSLSPRLHNGGYRRLGRRALFLPLPVTCFESFMREASEGGSFDRLGLPFHGGTISAPHKESALAIAAGGSFLARRCSSANNLALRHGLWWADSSDAAGALVPLMKRGIAVESQRMLVVGCGGAGRAIAAGLKEAGAEVTLMNRGAERGAYASRLLGLPLLPLDDAAIVDYSVVVNATPVGRDRDEAPFSIESLSPDATVIDLVYGSSPTRLMRRTRERGLTAIDGCEVLRAQVYEQFRLLTGTCMPSEAMDAVLGPELEPDSELLAISGT